MWENDIINYYLIIRDYKTSDFGELAQLVVCSIRVDLLTSTSKRYKWKSFKGGKKFWRNFLRVQILAKIVVVTKFAKIKRRN